MLQTLEERLRRDVRACWEEAIAACTPANCKEYLSCAQTPRVNNGDAMEAPKLETGGIAQRLRAAGAVAAMRSTYMSIEKGGRVRRGRGRRHH